MCATLSSISQAKNVTKLEMRKLYTLPHKDSDSPIIKNKKIKNICEDLVFNLKLIRFYNSCMSKDHSLWLSKRQTNASCC